MTTHPDPDYLNIVQKWKDLAGLAKNFEVAKLPIYSEGSDFREVVKDLENLIAVVDPLIAAYGDYVKANSSGSIELRLFQDQLAGALEGNAFYEVESVAELADEEMSELQAAE